MNKRVRDEQDCQNSLWTFIKNRIGSLSFFDIAFWQGPCKKLSKYFKDEKLSLIDKERVWLLCSGNDIVWVINRRADNRFQVTESTKQIIKIELQ